MSRSRAYGTMSSWLLYFRNSTNFHTVSYITWTPLWTTCASAAAILSYISANVLRGLIKESTKISFQWHFNKVWEIPHTHTHTQFAWCRHEPTSGSASTRQTTQMFSTKHAFHHCGFFFSRKLIKILFLSSNIPNRDDPRTPIWSQFDWISNTA